MIDADIILEQEVQIPGKQGLHARPAGKISQEAQRYTAEIRLCLNDTEVDAKSVLDILTLAATPGSSVLLRAAGPDAREALDALTQIFANNFEENP